MSFNFDQWIKQNDLVQVKDIFIKQNANTSETLKITSPQFAQVLINLAKLHWDYYPRIMQAIDKLQNVSDDEKKLYDDVSDKENIGDSWDSNLKGSGQTIKGNILIDNGHGGYNTAFLRNIVSSGIHIWKFKVNHYNSWLMFGIWDTNYDRQKKINSGIGEEANTAYVFDFKEARLNKYDKICHYHNSNGQNWTDNGSYGIKCETNMTLSIYLDFHQLTLSFIINNKDYGVAFNIKKGEYSVAVSSGGTGDAIELIMYQKP